MIPPSKFAQRSALGGAVVWGAMLFFRTGDSPEMELIQKIFLFGIFVIVPLAASIIALREDWLSLRLAIFIQPVAAVICLTSFLLDAGIVAALLVIPWFATVSLIALAGLTRIFLSQRRQVPELSISAGMVYLPIGGAWLIGSRMGIQPFGFGDTIVLLTALHFHFAGFAAPVLAGLSGRYAHQSRTSSNVAVVAASAIVIGTPIVAAGITASPVVALVGAAIVTLGVLLLALLVIIGVIPTVRSRLAQSLFVFSSAAGVAAMVLACLYAYSIVTHTVLIDIPHMAMTHGLLNSFGFVLCGLLAHNLARE